MKKKIQESIIFLINEFKRLKKKEKEDKLTKEENIQFKKLASFLGKNIK